MHRFWTLFSGPLVETVQPRRILEIGAEFGWNTRNILEYCRRTGARADIIDPVALPSLRDTLAAFPEEHRYHQAKSLEVIGKIDAPDILFLDGDHNWRTVFHELTQIYTHARETKAQLPILLAHDCAWPYARRDMYYDPDAFSPEQRHAYAYKGIFPGQSELTDQGLNGRFANALHEGGPQNGVLTAIEDFIKSWPTPISLHVIPFFNGMGIAVPEERRTPELDALLASFFSGEKMLEATKALERQTMTIIAEGLQRDAMLIRRTDALRRARELLDSQAARIAALEAELPARECESLGFEQLQRSARALASRSRYRDAVELGQRANRKRADAQLQRDLIQWRHNAINEISQGGPGPGWPPQTTDPRPDLIDQIPEIEAAALDPETLGGALLNHGSLIVRRLLSPELAASLLADVERAYEARANDADANDEQQSWYVPFVSYRDPNLTQGRALSKDASILMADSPRIFARWTDVLEECGVLGTVSEYLGERPVASARKTTMYRVPPNSGSQWHQDGAFLGEKTRTVNLWVALTACGKDAPGLEIVPWRLPQIIPPGTHGSLFDWSVGERKVEELARGRLLAFPRFAPGDAILFDHLCLHRTGVRAGMTRVRYSFETWMFAPSTYPDSAAILL